MSKPHHDRLSRGCVPGRELHQLDALLNRQRRRLAGAAAQSVPVQLRKEVVEKPEQAVKVDSIAEKGRGNYRQRSADLQLSGPPFTERLVLVFRFRFLQRRKNVRILAALFQSRLAFLVLDARIGARLQQRRGRLGVAMIDCCGVVQWRVAETV